MDNETKEKTNEKKQISKKLREVNTKLNNLIIGTKTPNSLESTLNEFKEWFNKEEKIQITENKETNSSISQIKFKYALSLLKCLTLINKIATKVDELEKETNLKMNNKEIENIPVLSIKEYKTIQQSMEIIVKWGINTLLIQGVGSHLEKDLERKRNDKFLFQILQQLLQLSKDPNVNLFSTVVLGEQLPFIFGGLIQICYSPLSTQKKQEIKSQIEISSPNQIYELDKETSKQQTGVASPEQMEKARKYVNNLIGKTNNLGLVVSSMLELMSSSNDKKTIWLKKVCSTLLSRILLRKGGVSAILSVLLYQDTSKDYHIGHFVNASMLVVTVPRQASSIEEYYSIICPQLIPLLIQTSNTNLYKAVSIIIQKMLEQNPNIAKKALMEALDSSFIHLIQQKELEINKEDCICDEQGVDRMIDIIYAFLQHSESKQSILDLITPYMIAIVKIYCFAHQSKSNLKQKCKTMLATFLRINPKANKLMKSMLLPSSYSHLKSNSIVTLSPGGSGGIEIKRVFKKNNLVFNQNDVIWNAEAIVELLEELDDSFLVGNLFVELLFDFSLLKQDVNFDMPSILEDSSKITHQLSISELLMLMTTKLASKSVFHNAIQVCSFLKLMFQNSDPEIQSLCLIILESLLSGKMKLKKEEEVMLFDLLPFLQNFVEENNSEFAEIAKKLIGKINAPIKTWLEKDEPKMEDESQEIESLESCLTDLSDPLLPVRAHGLITLRKLILKKDEKTLQNVEQILDIFSEQIKDEDTYIYLGAVQGFSALADVLPEKIIPLICNFYIDLKLSETTRAKIGETLLQIAQRLNEVLVKYANYFVNVLIKGVKDESPLIRASSLSNLGTMCKYLRWSVHPFIVDILNCANYCIKIEKKGELMVRRASVVLLVLLLDGMGSDVVQLIGTETFLSMQSTLKLVSEDFTEDQVTRSQALIALSLIDDILKLHLSNYLN